MKREIYESCTCILKEELIPAMGCTEPIAVAYCAALAVRELGAVPENTELRVSANIVKNVKSVVVPHTGGLRGLEAAAAAGIIAGDAGKELQVISCVSEKQIEDIGNYLKASTITVIPSEKNYIFDIDVTVFSGSDYARAELAGNHTNLILLEKNGNKSVNLEYADSSAPAGTDRSVLTVERIVEFADCVNLDDVRDTISRQIEYNTAIADEGLRGDYGANIGRVLLSAYGDSVHNKAKAYAAAGSDARMNGCEMPVVINSGSGNQGLTASLPVIVYARDMGAGDNLLYRALVVSNLITIHLKSGIGSLSAYCGATAAGCGAAAGITYLHGGRYNEIAHTVVNSIAIDSGMICDGAKASCAAKIASAVEAGLIGLQMQERGSEFFGGDGIVVKGVENTIKNIGILARDGMRDTDKTIIRIMTGACV